MSNAYSHADRQREFQRREFEIGTISVSLRHGWVPIFHHDEIGQANQSENCRRENGDAGCLWSR